MNSEKDLNARMERVMDYQNKEHEKNRVRIKNGFRSMLIVPTIFLVLMFTSDLTGTSKLVMLVIWIVSMLLIAAYLVVVEYVDHKLLNMMEDDDPPDISAFSETAPEGEEENTI